MKKILFLVLLLIAVGCRVVPAQTSNFPSDIPNGAKTGLPEGGSFEGTRENVNLSNGNLNINLPLLSLSGVAGLDLKLSLLYDSRVIALGGDQAPVQDQYDGTQYFPPGPTTSPVGGLAFAGGRLSIPTLMWRGVNTPFFIGPGANGCGYDCPPDASNGGSVRGTMACPGEFVFTDMTGAMHGFLNFPPCENIPPSTVVDVDDVRDGSLLRLDTHNIHDMIVIDRSGIQYHYNLTANYSWVPFKITDLNGNQLTFSSSGTQVNNYTVVITDTQNRIVTVTPTDISFKDSDGTDRHISASSSQVGSSPALAVNWGSCTSTTGNRYQEVGSRQYSGTYRWTLQLPGAEKYDIDLDGLGEIIKVSYPSGGYSAYEYQNKPYAFHDDFWTCNSELRQIAKRRVCSEPSGSCSQSQEDVTVYTPSSTNTLGQLFTDANGTMDVLDPSGFHTLHDFVMSQDSSNQGFSPAESNVFYKDGRGNVVRKVHTEYKLPTDPSGRRVCATSPVPTKITTTLSDSNVASYVTMDYQTVQLKVQHSATYCDGVSMTDNMVTKNEYGFDGALVRTTSQSWSNGTPEGIHVLDRLSSRSVSSADGSLTSSESYLYNTFYDLTQQTRSGTSAAAASIGYGRDSYGRITSSTDANQVTTTYDYTPSWSNSGCSPTISAFPTKVTNILQQETRSTYNPCTGTLYSSTDANGKTTTYAYDWRQRQTTVSLPDGGGSHMDYGAPSGFTFTKTVKLKSSDVLTTAEIHDGLGRTVDQTLTAPEGQITTSTAYDSRGLSASRTIPYIGTKPSLGTSFTYDALGRREFECDPQNGTGLSCTPQNAYKRASYSGAITTTFDESGRPSKQRVDALGRLTDVWSADDSKSATVHTAYEYNILDALTKVTQDGAAGEAQRVRTFTYNGLGQLITASNPEAGPICYGQNGSGTCVGSYDGNGNLLAKTDARSVLTSYTYDVLNRLSSKTTSGGGYPTKSACYAYDDPAVVNGVGRLSSEWTQFGTCASSLPTSAATWKKIASYDEMGRVKREYQCPRTPCKEPNDTSAAMNRLDFAYDYDLAGNVSQATNGPADFATHQFHTTYSRDIANRLSNVRSDEAAVDLDLFGGTTYNQFGLISSARGLDPVTPSKRTLSETRDYDTYGRMIAMRTYASTRANTMSISSLPGTVYAGSFPTIAVQVSGCGTACGSATVSLDGGPLQTVHLNASGAGSVQVGVALTAGTHQITINYAGNASSLPSSASNSFTVQASSASATYIVSALSSNPVPAGGTVQLLTALGCESACGTVSVAVGSSSVLGSVTVNADGSVPPLSVSADQLFGTSLTVSYSGDSAHAPQSTTVPFIVASNVPSLSIYAWPAGAVFTPSSFIDFRGTMPSAPSGDSLGIAKDNVQFDFANFWGSYGDTGKAHRDWTLGWHIATVIHNEGYGVGKATSSMLYHVVAENALPPLPLNINLASSPVHPGDAAVMNIQYTGSATLYGYAQYVVDSQWLQTWQQFGYIGNFPLKTGSGQQLSNTLSPGTHTFYLDFMGGSGYRPTHFEVPFTVVAQ